MTLSKLTKIGHLTDDGSGRRHRLHGDASGLNALPVSRTNQIIHHRNSSTPTTPAIRSPANDFSRRDRLSTSPTSDRSSFVTPTNKIPGHRVHPTAPGIVPRRPTDAAPDNSVSPIGPGLIHPRVSPPAASPSLRPVPTL